MLMTPSSETLSKEYNYEEYMTHTISSAHLSLGRIQDIIEKHERIELGAGAVSAIEKCRKYLDSKMEDLSRPVYGVTTGFGSLCNVTIPEDKLSALQHNLVMSHACGTGDAVRPEIVKLMLLLKVQCLSYGHSGTQLITVQRLVDMFNNDILPVIYQQGSLGASGDLAPLAHMSLPLIGLGEVLYKGEIRQSKDVWTEMGWEPIRLQSKEGLALLNGTQFMSAHAVWSLIQCKKLSAWADKIGAMSLEAYDGRIEPFLPLTHKLRRHIGQMETAEAFLKLLDGSELMNMQKVHVQDPYSFRCIPQVHGAVKDNIRYVESVGNCHVRTREHLGTQNLPAYLWREGPSKIPGRQSRGEQRLHDSSVHRSFDSEPEQGPLLACVCGFDSIFTRAGRSRKHGLEFCDQASAGGG